MNLEDEIVIQLEDLRYIRLWFSMNPAATENCDACIGYCLYTEDKALIDGGEFDYNSDEKDYKNITYAIEDIIDFATNGELHSFTETNLTCEDFDD